MERSQVSAERAMRCLELNHDAAARWSGASPPGNGDERMLLTALLDRNRAALGSVLAGLTDEQLRRPHAPSGLTLLGIVKHLAAVERYWFQRRFLGEPAPAAEQMRPPGSDWRIMPDESTAAILARYERAVDRSRRIAATAALDAAARDPGPRTGLTLRWILLHMIEETARHNGHADLIRATIDGEVGE